MPRDKVTRGTGNVFADLGFKDPEGELAKARLAAAIRNAIEDQGLTQIQIARLIGLDPMSVSRLIRGRTTGFTANRLSMILNLLGHDSRAMANAER